MNKPIIFFMCVALWVMCLTTVVFAERIFPESGIIDYENRSDLNEEINVSLLTQVEGIVSVEPYFQPTGYKTKSQVYLFYLPWEKSLNTTLNMRVPLTRNLNEWIVIEAKGSEGQWYEEGRVQVTDDYHVELYLENIYVGPDMKAEVRFRPAEVIEGEETAFNMIYFTSGQKIRVGDTITLPQLESEERIRNHSNGNIKKYCSWSIDGMEEIVVEMDNLCPTELINYTIENDDDKLAVQIDYIEYWRDQDTEEEFYERLTPTKKTFDFDIEQYEPSESIVEKAKESIMDFFKGWLCVLFGIYC